MKKLKKPDIRLRRKARRKDKAGSSMAMAMIVMAVLVIWAMALAPLMTTTGKNALKVQTGYTDYLASRSAIEYAKSELEYIVRYEPPYTFAVIRDGDEYRIMPKKVNNTIDVTGYGSYINYSTSDNKLDAPKDTALGKEVAAICAVNPPPIGSNVYSILITTYIDGEKSLAFSATFTESGSLLILPESYKQVEALPLSDFLLVDGKLGSNEVWKSTISMSNATDLSFTETLQSFRDNPDGTYANSGEYPSVFKTTAHAAPSTGSGEIKDVITDKPFTTDQWVRPFAAYEEANGTNTATGAVWIAKSGSVYKVYLRDPAGGQRDITGSCSLYINGKSVTASNGGFSIPSTNYGYRVTVDYSGTGATYNTAANALNALPRYGMVMMESTGNTSAFEASKPTINPSITVDSYNGSTMTVRVKDAGEGALYYSNADGKWRSDPVYTNLDNSKVYYFYAYTPAKMVNGTVTPASDVTYAGAVAGYGKAVTMEQLESGKQYWVMDGNDYAMKNNNGLGTQKIFSVGNHTSGGYFTFAKTKTTSSTDTYNLNWDQFRWTVEKAKTEDKVPSYIYHSTGTTKNYLTLSAKLGVSEYWTEEQIGWTGNTDKAKAANWATYSAGLSNAKTALTFNQQNNAISQYTTDSITVYVQTGRKWDWIKYEYSYSTTTLTKSTNSYLEITNSGVNGKSSGSAVYFIEVPAWAKNPLTNVPSAPTAQGGKSITADVNAASWSNLKANGETVTNLNALAPGHYILTGESDAYFLIGKYSVNKSALSGTASISYKQDTTDDSSFTITATSTNGDSAGARYLGWKNANEPDSSYRWFPATQNGNQYSVTLRLNYSASSQFVFAFLESGNISYTSKQASITAKDFIFADLSGMDIDPGHFEYRVAMSASAEKGFVVTWYRLPEGIEPRKVQLMFGTYTTDNEIEWSSTPGEIIQAYGVIILGYNSGEDDSVLRIPAPLPITNENGRTSSMIRGSSLYFMGGINGGASINTYNNTIYLSADLLVLNGSFTGGDKENFLGYVYVQPYTQNSPRNDTLLFAASDIYNLGGEKVFAKNCFYRIPSGTDIYDLSPTKTAKPASDEDIGTTFYYGHVDYNNIKYMESVRWAIREGYYPNIDMDIAYADKDQISHIVSGETIGWTNNGVMGAGNDNANSDSPVYNASYAVCAYVTEITGNVTRNAGRIMIAAKDSEGNSVLAVPYNLSFTTRYLSLGASEVLQQNNSEFRIYNLGLQKNFIQKVLNITGNNTYSSKSLQVDYEHHTTFSKLLSSNKHQLIWDTSPQICRYNSGANLFGNTNNDKIQPLMSPYTTKEIENLEGGLGVDKYIKIVDRYIYLSADANGDTNIKLKATNSVDLYMYTNYIHVASNVKEISTIATIPVWNAWSSRVLFNSQESGYTTDEYLGLFQTHSADSYSGILFRFDGDVTVTYTTEDPNRAWYDITWWMTESKTIPKGFYFVKISDHPNGITLETLAKNYTAYAVDPKTLPDYAVNLDPNNSNAFVDTGLWNDGGSGGFSGFKGGTVE